MTYPYIRITVSGKPDIILTEKEWIAYGAYNGFNGKNGRPFKKDIQGIETIYKDVKK